EVRAAHERAARQTEVNEAERPQDERVADGATPPDAGSESARWMPAFADSNAVSFCALYGHHHLDLFSPGVVCLVSVFIKPVTLLSLLPATAANPLHRIDGGAAAADAGAFG